MSKTLAMFVSTETSKTVTYDNKKPNILTIVNTDDTNVFSIDIKTINDTFNWELGASESINEKEFDPIKEIIFTNSNGVKFKYLASIKE